MRVWSRWSLSSSSLRPAPARPRLRSDTLLRAGRSIRPQPVSQVCWVSCSSIWLSWPLGLEQRLGVARSCTVPALPPALRAGLHDGRRQRRRSTCQGTDQPGRRDTHSPPSDHPRPARSSQRVVRVLGERLLRTRQAEQHDAVLRGQPPRLAATPRRPTGSRARSGCRTGRSRAAAAARAPQVSSRPPLVAEYAAGRGCGPGPAGTCRVSHSCQCRCGPVTNPVAPESPSRSPARTRWPGDDVGPAEVGVERVPAVGVARAQTATPNEPVVVPAGRRVPSAGA
ncbi:MAG: hypothetical protein KatS3mg063_1549 [Tepidiforma sp.]|nr:MAG: hypothetical protein KatS3mg063_1549 [Tepidiforma sp.]